MPIHLPRLTAQPPSYSGLILLQNGKGKVLTLRFAPGNLVVWRGSFHYYRGLTRNATQLAPTPHLSHLPYLPHLPYYQYRLKQQNNFCHAALEHQFPKCNTNVCKVLFSIRWLDCGTSVGVWRTLECQCLATGTRNHPPQPLHLGTGGKVMAISS